MMLGEKCSIESLVMPVGEDHVAADAGKSGLIMTLVKTASARTTIAFINLLLPIHDEFECKGFKRFSAGRQPERPAYSLVYLGSIRCSIYGPSWDALCTSISQYFGLSRDRAYAVV